MAKKKTKASKKKTVKRERILPEGFGRPKGAKSYVPKGLDVRAEYPLSRRGSPNKKKGLRRLILETRDEEYAVNLQRLATLIRKKDKDLLNILTPAPTKRKKKTAA